MIAATSASLLGFGLVARPLLESPRPCKRFNRQHALKDEPRSCLRRKKFHFWKCVVIGTTAPAHIGAVG
jgi:hypothetical protein